MDYVVFGIGFGATLLVLGLLIRDVGPRARFRRPSHPDGIFHAEELVARVSWGRFCTALGTILAIAGTIFIAITAICMLVRVSDQRAGAFMLGSLLLLCVLMAIWTWAFFDRFGSYGILPERDEQTALSPAKADSGSPPGAQPTGSGTPSAASEPAVQAAGASFSAPLAPAPDGSRTLGTAEVDAPVADERESPDEQQDQAPVMTPEERMAEADSPVEHDSLEADLDTPLDSSRRHWRHGHRPPSSSTAAHQATDDGAEQERDADSTEPSSDREQPSRGSGDTREP